MALLPGKPLVGVICPSGRFEANSNACFHYPTSEQGEQLPYSLRMPHRQVCHRGQPRQRVSLGVQAGHRNRATSAGASGRVSPSLILPRWLSNQRVTDSLVAYTNLYFLQCRSRGANLLPCNDRDEIRSLCLRTASAIIWSGNERRIRRTMSGNSTPNHRLRTRTPPRSKYSGARHQRGSKCGVTRARKHKRAEAAEQRAANCSRMPPRRTSGLYFEAEIFSSAALAVAA